MSDSAAESVVPSSEQSRTSLWRRFASAIALCVAIVYLGYYVARQAQELEPALARLRPLVLLEATAAIVAMLALKSVYHVVAIRRLGNRDTPPATQIVSAYATAQVIRYLPGKVLGVVYEMAQLAGQVPGHRVVAANVVQTLHTNALTILVLATAVVWLGSGRTDLAIAMLSASVAVMWVAHRQHLTERTLAWAAARIPRLRELPQLPTPSGHAALRASIVLLAEWVPYFLFWVLILPPGSQSFEHAVMLGSCYAGASLVANLAVLMPSGLVLREALFLWVGSQLALDPGALIVLGTLSRLLFTLADAALVPLAWGIDSLRARGWR